ncbi:hypothetical protein CB1_000692001 [Camelus ferus]|nr:hypothetical protein CB1_000692001 [Camelus ferus]
MPVCTSVWEGLVPVQASVSYRYQMPLGWLRQKKTAGSRERRTSSSSPRTLTKRAAPPDRSHAVALLQDRRSRAGTLHHVLLRCGKAQRPVSGMFRFPGSNVPKAREVMWFQRHKLSSVYITEKPSRPGVTALKIMSFGTKFTLLTLSLERYSPTSPASCLMQMPVGVPCSTGLEYYCFLEILRHLLTNSNHCSTSQKRSECRYLVAAHRVLLLISKVPPLPGTSLHVISGKSQFSRRRGTGVMRKVITVGSSPGASRTEAQGELHKAQAVLGLRCA